MIIEKTYKVNNMSCAACSSYVERNISKLDGVKNTEVSLLLKEMKVVFDDKKTGTKEFKKVLDKGGYELVVGKDKNVKYKKVNHKLLLVKLVLSLILGLALMYFAMGHMIGFELPSNLHTIKTFPISFFIQTVLVTFIIALNNKIYINGLKGIFKLSFNMDSLVFVGSIASLGYSFYSMYKFVYYLSVQNFDNAKPFMNEIYLDSCGVVIVLVSLGKFFEERSKKKTTDLIMSLMNESPDSAVVIDENGNETKLRVEYVNVGDEIVIKTGEKIPLDGVVLSGKCYVDESTFTGESKPCYKKANDKVFATTINTNGVIRVKVTSKYNETSYSKMVDYVKKAATSKAKVQNVADRISRIFVPVVFALSIVTFLAWYFIGTKSIEDSLMFAVTVLVVSCPCALGLATPTAIMVGMGVGAKNKIFIRNGEALEESAKINTLVFDKTGTITKGNMVVKKIVSYSRRIDLITYLLEKNSSHPISQAIQKYILKTYNKEDTKNIKIEDALYSDDLDYKSINFNNIDFGNTKFSYEEIFGKGISLKINSDEFICGNEKLISDYKISNKFKDEVVKYLGKGYTIIYTADVSKKKVLGFYVLSDEVKDDAKKTIALMKQNGYKTILLSGDKKETCEHIGGKLGFDEVYSEVFPEDKGKKVKSLMTDSCKVAMVGDGVNDIIALESADVGIAVGSGADASIESSDIVLHSKNLLSVFNSLMLGRRTYRTIKQNLFWAFIYNIICIPLAGGVLYIPFGLKFTPIIGSLAMCFSSIFVVTNALRIKRFKAFK